MDGRVDTLAADSGRITRNTDNGQPPSSALPVSATKHYVMRNDAPQAPTPGKQHLGLQNPGSVPWIRSRHPKCVQTQSTNERCFVRPALVVPNLEWSRGYAIEFHLR